MTHFFKILEDWTCNLEKAIATVLNKDRSDATDSDEEVRNSRKKSRADSNRKEKVSANILRRVNGNYHHRKLPLPHDIFITATITESLNFI